MNTKRQAAPSDTFAHTSVNPLFPTPMWIADLPGPAFQPLNDRLRAAVDAMTGPRVQQNPSDTFQTPHDLHERAEFAPLVHAIETLVGGALKQLAIEPAEVVFTAMWANVNPPGSKHSVHSHPNNFFSGVYYVQCDPRANVICFYDPRPQAEVMMPSRAQQTVFTTNMVELEAKPGRLALFPAWLKHDVPINLSQRERISVSFNLMFPQFTERMAVPMWRGGKDKRVGG